MSTNDLLLPPESPQRERYRLARAIRDMRGAFALFPVESNLPWADSLLFLDALAAELAPGGLKLRRITLGRDAWNLLAVLHEQPDIQPDEFVVVLGLESTPSIVSAGGEENKRPPALNALNVMREAIERKLSVPLILWCVPYAYDALLKHAPDFFDHFSALFAVMEEKPEPEKASERRSLIPSFIEPERRDSPLSSVESDLKFYEKRLKEFPNPSPGRARALIGYSDALGKLPTGDISERRDLALSYAQEAERYLQKTQSTHEHARSLNNLGNVYFNLSSGDRDANLRSAISYYEAALRVYTEERFPMQWATTQSNLGLVHTQLPSGDRDANLRSVISYYKAVLRVYTEESFPIDWATTQNNLGSAYGDLSSGDRDTNLCSAISYYEAALRVYTEENFPIDWARTQNNLGNMFADLFSDNCDVSLRQAIACYEAALRVYTEEHFPMQWAATQNNLGNAYSHLPSGDRDTNFRQATICYEAALRVRTEEQFPVQWAMTQCNWGILECGRGEFVLGLVKLRQSRAVLERIGHTHYVEWIDSVIAQQEASLGSPGLATPSGFAKEG